ncbi:MAG: hypothetical protein Q8903_15120 [Bacteroidota bacterium]|nr:hypothetical protein [Bacteroidota bacterium]
MELKYDIKLLYDDVSWCIHLDILSEIEATCLILLYKALFRIIAGNWFEHINDGNNAVVFIMKAAENNYSFYQLLKFIPLYLVLCT